MLFVGKVETPTTNWQMNFMWLYSCTEIKCNSISKVEIRSIILRSLCFCLGNWTFFYSLKTYFHQLIFAYNIFQEEEKRQLKFSFVIWFSKLNWHNNQIKVKFCFGFRSFLQLIASVQIIYNLLHHRLRSDVDLNGRFNGIQEVESNFLWASLNTQRILRLFPSKFWYLPSHCPSIQNHCKSINYTCVRVRQIKLVDSKSRGADIGVCNHSTIIFIKASS